MKQQPFSIEYEKFGLSLLFATVTNQTTFCTILVQIRANKSFRINTSRTTYKY